MSLSIHFAIDKNLTTVCLKYKTQVKYLYTALAEHRNLFDQELKAQLKRLNNVKWYIVVHVSFSKVVDGTEIVKTPVFHGKTRIFTKSDDFTSQFNEAVDKMFESKSKFVQDGSAWRLKKIERIDLCIVKYKPLYAASYIPTPAELKHPSKGLINIVNRKDKKCFLWLILAALHSDPSRNNRVSFY